MLGRPLITERLFWCANTLMSFNLEQAVAASLVVEIGGDDRQLDLVLKRSDEKVKRFAGQKSPSLALTADDKSVTNAADRARATLENVRKQTVNIKMLADASGIVAAAKAANDALDRQRFGAQAVQRQILRDATDTGNQLVRQAQDDARQISKTDADAARARIREAQQTKLVLLREAQDTGRALLEIDRENTRQATKQAAEAKRAADRQARAFSGAALVARGGAISSVGGGIRAAGQAATYGYSAPVAAAGGYAIKQAINYEADFANVKKTTVGTAAQSQALRAQLEELSTEKGMPVAFKQITDIASMVGQLGVARDQVKNVTKDIIQLNVATKLTTDTGAMAMVKFANSIGEPAQNIGRLGSVISELDKDSKATSNEALAMALRIGGVGHVAGLSGPQILAFANAFAGVGVRAQQGGSAISTAIIQIDRATNAGGAKLAQFANVAGMSADQFKKAFKENAAGALVSFIEGLGKLHDKHVDLIPVMDALGLKNKLQIDAMLRASGAGSDLSKALGRVDKAYADNTATGERYKRATDNTAQSLKDIQHEANLAAVKLGNELLPTLKKMEPDAEHLLHTVNGWIDAFAKLPKPVKQGALEFLAVTIAAGPVVSVLGGVVTGVGFMTRAVGAFKLLKTAEEMKGVLDGLKGVEGGAKDAGAEIGTLKTTAGGLKDLLTSPMTQGSLGQLLLKGGIVTLGVGLDVYLLKKDFDTAKETKQTYASAAASDASLGRDGDLQRRTDGAIVNIVNALSSLRDGIKADKAKLADMPRENKPYELLTGPVQQSGRYKDLQARIRKEYADAAALTGSLHQQQGVIKGITAAAHPATAVVKGLVAGIDTPEAKAPCALFASKLLTKMGEAVPVIAGAKGLRDYAVSHGAKQVPTGQAQSGDLVVWHGARYGARQGGGERSGYHVGVSMGSGQIAQSSNNVKRTMAMYDAAHASVYRFNTHGGGVPFNNSVEFNPALFTKTAAGSKAGKFADTVGMTAQERETHNLNAARAKGLISAATYHAAMARLEANADTKEAKAQKTAHKHAETALEAHVRRMNAIARHALTVTTGQQKRQGMATAALAQARGDLDPEGVQIGQERAGVLAKYNARVKAVQASWGLYSTGQQAQIKVLSDARDAALDAVNDKLKTHNEAAADKTRTEADKKAKSQFDAHLSTRGAYDQYLTGQQKKFGQDTQEFADYTEQLGKLRAVPAAIATARKEIVTLNHDGWKDGLASARDYYKGLREDARAASVELLRTTQDKATANAWLAAKLSSLSRQQADAERTALQGSQRFELEQHGISLSQYRGFLGSQLSLTKKYADSAKGIVSEQYMALKGQLDEIDAQRRAASPFNSLADGAKTAFSSALEQAHSYKDGLKAWEGEVAGIIRHLAVMWASSQLFGSRFGGGLDFGRNKPGAAPPNAPGATAPNDPAASPSGGFGGSGAGGGFGSLLSAGLSIYSATKSQTLTKGGGGKGLAATPGIAPSRGGGGTDWLGTAASVAPMMGRQGGAIGAGLSLFGAGLSILDMFTHKKHPATSGAAAQAGGPTPVFITGMAPGLMGSGIVMGSAPGAGGGKGGALLGLAGMAASFIPGGGVASKVLGGLGHIFHFANGGVVPGQGNQDSVPAMLMPREVVLSQAMLAGTAPPPALPPSFITNVQHAAPADISGTHRRLDRIGDAMERMTGGAARPIEVNQTNHYATQSGSGSEDLATVLRQRLG